MIANDVTTIVVPITDNTILLNLKGDDKEYKGLPNIGDIIGLLLNTTSSL